MRQPMDKRITKQKTAAERRLNEKSEIHFVPNCDGIADGEGIEATVECQ